MKTWNLRKALVVYKEEASHPSQQKIHSSSLERVEEALSKQGFSYRSIRRENLRSEIQEDFVITVGGDGTFLHASHFSHEQHLFLGVNSVPHASHGAFCYTDAKSFEKTLQNLLQDKLSAGPLFRLQAKINGKKVKTLALNDILVANPSPAGTSRYQFSLGKKKEEQKSSGVWISTASGSSAAIRSAGGKVLQKHTDHFQFLVREPFLQGKKKMSILKGILKPQEKIRIRIQMTKGSLFIDGSHISHDLRQGDVVEIGLSKEVVWAVV